MGKFSDLIIVSDLDGTFFGTNGELLQVNLDKIEYFKSEGGLFTFATGRDVPAVDTLIPNAADIVNLSAILSNGSFIYDFRKREKHCERCISIPDFKPFITDIITRFPDVGVRIGIREPQGFFCPNYTELLSKELAPFKKYTYVLSIDEMPQQYWYKAVLIADCGRIDEVKAYIDTLDTSMFTIFKSSPMLLEVLSCDATKGKQLSSLKRYINNLNAKCIGVGDYDNDFELLSMADITASPENAVDKIKNISDIHLCHHTDGAIADLIDILDKNKTVYT